MTTSISPIFSSALLDTPIAIQAVYTLPFGTALLIFAVLLLFLVIAMVWNAKAYQLPDSLIAHNHGNDLSSSPQRSDDLTVIEGIGPKTAATFQASGILTYQDLADSEIEKLQAILAEANLRLGTPETWPKQAQLAAKGDWQGLQQLQDELTAGR
jgi:predicted flap endonuclease-1-like 5' DNA nuclease